MCSSPVLDETGQCCGHAPSAAAEVSDRAATRISQPPHRTPGCVRSEHVQRGHQTWGSETAKPEGRLKPAAAVHLDGADGEAERCLDSCRWSGAQGEVTRLWMKRTSSWEATSRRLNDLSTRPGRGAPPGCQTRTKSPGSLATHPLGLRKAEGHGGASRRAEIGRQGGPTSTPGCLGRSRMCPTTQLETDQPTFLSGPRQLGRGGRLVHRADSARTVLQRAHIRERTSGGCSGAASARRSDG